MRKIIDRVFTFDGLIVGRVYLLEDDDGLTIIDSGLGLAARRVLRQLARSGRSSSDVKRILITHGHTDHVGGLAALKEATGAQVIVSAYERSYIEGKKPILTPKRDQVPPLARTMSPGKPIMLTPVSVDHVVTDGDVLTEVLGGLHVVSTPGHAPGHLAFWQPAMRILFCGDVVMNMIRLRLPFAAYTPDMKQNKRSLKRLVDLDPEIICFGHGPPFKTNAAERLRSFAAKVGAV